MGRYRNKYRIDSIRAQWWDYGWDAAYFITICTKDSRHCFGKIENGKMCFTPTGAIAATLWHDIPSRNPIIELGEYIIMPNHMHGILILNN